MRELHGVAIQQRPIVTQVAERLEQLILGGQLAPGTALRESRLAPRLGVARNTVREAIRGLVPSGLVRHVPNRGFVVPGLTADDVHDLYNARRVLELASAQAPVAELQSRLSALRSALDGMVAAHSATDWDGVFRGHLRFHTILLGVLGSARLEQFLSVVFGELQLGMAAAERQRPSANQLEDNHRPLLELIAAGDRVGFGKLLQEHLEVGERRVLRGLADQVAKEKA